MILRYSLLFLLALIGTYIPFVHQGGFPINDLAADMLLGNLIQQQGYLLFGHYSVWGFHHPGPFWFYYNYLFEFLPIPKVSAWYLGNMFFNSLILIFSARALSFYFFRHFHFLFCFLFVFIVINFITEIQNIWMPARIILPYGAFLICCLHLMRKNFVYLLPAVFLMCILIHGYVIMPIFTFPLLFLSLMIGGNFKQNFNRHKNIILFSFLIAFLFVLPILIDYFFNAPNSNFNAILNAKLNQKLGTPTPDDWRLLDNLLFKEFYLFFLQLLGVFILFISLFSLRKNNSNMQFMLHQILRLIMLCALVYLIFYFYYILNYPAEQQRVYAFFFTKIMPILIVASMLALCVFLLNKMKIKINPKIEIVFAFVVISFAFLTHAYSPFGWELNEDVGDFEKELNAIILKENLKEPVPLTCLVTKIDSFEKNPGFYVRQGCNYLAGVLLQMPQKTCFAMPEKRQTLEDIRLFLPPNVFCQNNTKPRFAFVASVECVENKGQNCRASANRVDNGAAMLDLLGFDGKMILFPSIERELTRGF